MSIFGNLGTEGHEETNDRVGGFAAKDTDAYLAKVKMAYADKAQSGAQNVNLVLDLGGSEYSETIYITNKKGENFFHPKDGNGNPDTTKKVPLPGFTTVDDLCLMISGKPLNQQDTEEKIVKIYDYDEKKEVPKSKHVLVDLIGGEVYVGLVRQTVDKNKKNETTGDYEPTGETRDENVIEKVFHYPSKVTVVEAREAQKAGKDAEATFYDKWVETNKGKTRNKSKGASGQGGNNGRPGSAPQGNGGGASKTPSLFGGKKPE